MKRFIIILLSLIAINAYCKKCYIVEMPEMEIRNYEFMTEIAELLKNTNHYITTPQANIVISDSCSYHISIKSINDKGETLRNRTIDFVSDGSYIIDVTYTIHDSGILGIPWCMFYVNDLRFVTFNYLNIYFIGCKRAIGKIIYPFYGLVADRFWFFEVVKGKVINGFYFYEENSDIITANVYDLINKKMMRYMDWKREYPHFD